MDEKDRINILRKKLYSRTSQAQDQKRHGLHSSQSSVKKSWSQPEMKKIMPVKEKRSFLGLFFVVSLLFFLGSALFGSFYFLGEKNIVSADNVEIEIQGPTAVGGGDTLGLQISIVNKNSTTLELTDLLIEYPEGTRSPDNLGRELTRSRDSLGSIQPGERVKKSVEAILFGEENTQKEIKVTVEYRVAGSNAIFFAEKLYQVTLSSSPVSVSVRSFTEVTSGQEIDFSVVVNSNSSTVVENLVLQAEYPFGFSFIEASPRPQFSNSVWEIGNLNPEEEKTIHIKGVMTGQDNEERTFRFAVGVGDEFDVKKMVTTFVTANRGITIQRPFIGTDITLNNTREDIYIFENGEEIRGEIAWKNNLTEAVSDAQIEVRISGSSVDESSVIVERGFYNSVTNTARWSKDTSSEFAVVNPSQAGIVQFSFSTRNISALGLRNPEVVLEVTVRGKRDGEDNVPEQIESVLTRSILISSDLSLTQRLLHGSGPLSNKGAVPPVAEKETTYTVMWTVTNTANHISGVKVTGVLPPYVQWKGNFNPNNSNVSFNSDTNQVTWNVGEVPQGVGTNISPKELAFQIGFTPSLSQVGEIPTLVHTQSITGFDQFTESQISDEVAPLTTRIQSEPGLPSNHERVSQ
ncbi:DUF11 domain-containing protein [Candidatus Kaiserbacteria bacterium]|nr:DUF11 domain-containing protein [Candidatus Kaiserbacteria bacterium]